MTIGQCFKLSDILVRQYDGVKYLSLCDGASIEVVANIEDIPDRIELIGDSTKLIIPPVLEQYILFQVLLVNVKIVTQISKCHRSKSAKLVVSDNNKTWYLTAFNEELDAILDGTEGTSIEERLLTTSNLTLQYCPRTNVIKNVTKINLL